MTTPIRFVEVFNIDFLVDEEARTLRCAEDISIWAYTNPVALGRDLRDYFGDFRFERLYLRPCTEGKVTRTESWDTEGYRSWVKGKSGSRLAYNMGPVVLPDMKL